MNYEFKNLTRFARGCAAAIVLLVAALVWAVIKLLQR